MIAAIYVSLCAFLIVWLSLNVIKKRRKNKVRFGDGDIEELKLAIVAHSNAVEYIPIALLLLIAFEFNGGYKIIVHAFGWSLLIGRIIHARGILSGNLKERVLGMQVTISTIIALGFSNVVTLPYENLL